MRISGYIDLLSRSADGGERYLEYERARALATIPQTWIVSTNSRLGLPVAGPAGASLRGQRSASSAALLAPHGDAELDTARPESVA